MTRFYEDWDDLSSDLVNYGNLPEGRVLEIVKILSGLNDDIINMSHVDLIRSHTARIRNILDDIDADPDYHHPTLNAGNSAEDWLKPREPVRPMKSADAPPFMGNGAWYRPRGQDEWIRFGCMSDLRLVMPDRSYTIQGAEGWRVAEDEDGWTTIRGDVDYVASEIDKYIARLTADADKEDT